MDFTFLSEQFELASNQARAIKTLHSNHVIKTPTFSEAREVMRTHIREILSGAIPFYDDNGDLRVAEDMPQCVDAFRTLLLYSPIMDERLDRIQHTDDTSLSNIIEKLAPSPATIEHKHAPLEVILVNEKHDQ